MNEDNGDFSIDVYLASRFNKWHHNSWWNFIVFNNSVKLQWILLSFGIHCSVDLLSFSNFDIICSTKVIVGDIWSVCLVLPFGSFLDIINGKSINSTALLDVHCFPCFFQTLDKVSDGPLLQITQGIVSKYCLHHFTYHSMQQLWNANHLCGDSNPVFCWSGFGSWAFPEAAKPIQRAIP